LKEIVRVEVNESNQKGNDKEEKKIEKKNGD
jgi:hypothetical protein